MTVGRRALRLKSSRKEAILPVKAVKVRNTPRRQVQSRKISRNSAHVSNKAAGLLRDAFHPVVVGMELQPDESARDWLALQTGIASATTSWMQIVSRAIQWSTVYAEVGENIQDNYRDYAQQMKLPHPFSFFLKEVEGEFKIIHNYSRTLASRMSDAYVTMRNNRNAQAGGACGTLPALSAFSSIRRGRMDAKPFDATEWVDFYSFREDQRKQRRNGLSFQSSGIEI